MDRRTRTQLGLIAELARLMADARIAFWLRGGWALDFHLGRVTRPHEDIDLVARFRQRSRVRRMLEANGYRLVRITELAAFHFLKRGQDIGVAFIWTDDMARTVTPGREFWPWPPEAFTDRRYALQGIPCRAMSLEALLEEKENYERYTGRPLRPKDHESLAAIRRLLETREAG